MTDDLQTRFVEAATTHRSGDKRRAREMFASIIERWPGCHEALYMHGMIGLELGDSASAEPSFRRALAADPNNPEYLYRLGSVLLRSGRADEAADALAKAAQETDDFAPLLFELGQACMACRRHDQAADAFRRVMTLEPGSVPARIGLISALGRAARYDDAISAAHEFVRDHPNNPEAHARLAVMLERVSKLEAAAAAAGRALELQPDNGAALFVRGNLRMRAGELEPAREDLERALASALPANEKRDIARTLGLVLDRLGRCDDAYARFVESKRPLEEMPRSVRVLAEEFERFIDACRREITAAAIVRWPAPPPYPPGRQAPVFFVGFPRSGTTLLEQMLAAHPRFVTTDELPLLPRVRDIITRLAGSIENVPGFLGRLNDQQIRELREEYWTDAERSLGRDVVASRRVIDKHPLNTASLCVVRRLFPDARVMMSFRDPRDVVLSCFMNLTRTATAAKVFRTLEDGASFYAAVIGLWLSYRRELGLAYVEVKYEDVVADAEAQCRRVLEFLGEPWDDTLRRFTEKAQGKVVRSTSYQQVTEGLYTRAIGRWTKYRRHFGRADEILAPFVRELCYPPST